MSTTNGSNPNGSAATPGVATNDRVAASQAAATCPVVGPVAGLLTPDARNTRQWWPHQLNLSLLHQHQPVEDPHDEDFDYAEAFRSLDLAAVKADLAALMTDSQDWWPADWGHYGPFMIRMAWHAAGTYRVGDGRGGAGSGTLRFAPLNSWPDNANLDKARRLLWPLKQKYGSALSWGDLHVLAGNVALESMGFKTFGFGGGRVDKYSPEEDVYWGPESEWLDDQRYAEGRVLETPLGAVQMGLIYVNPQGPNGNPDPAAAAHDIRETFARMAMNDEETVALVAGGHTFGKSHAAGVHDTVGPEPEAAPLEQMGLGWKNRLGGGHSENTITSELEGAWTNAPTTWDNGYFDNLFGYEWEQHKSPAGGVQWKPVGTTGDGTVPDAHVEGRMNAPMMHTTDIALRTDPAYEQISRRFHENPDEFADAFARAWYKLTHRDMGPHPRLLGPEVPEPQLWQDPVPAADHALIDDADVAELKKKLLDSGLSISQLVATAWAAASSFRGTDKRGGANGGRIRLEPQRNWAVNDPEVLAKVLPVLEKVQADFNGTLSGGKRVSFADVVVLGGVAAVEKAAADAGTPVSVPFTPGRTDATADQTDADAMAVLEPTADGFRNYLHPSHQRPAAELLVDRAHLLTLSAPEMTVLLAGLRVLNANTGRSPLGVFTDRPEILTNDFLVTVLSPGLDWSVSPKCEHFFEGKDCATGATKWQATAVDLAFGSNSQLRAIAEVYAADGAQQKFANDFAAAFAKVMDLERFDVKPTR